MFRLKDLLFENEREKFEKFKGNYNFQGHISTEKDLELENVSVKFVDIKSGWHVNFSKYTTPHGFWTSTIYKSLDKFTSKWESFWHEGEDSVAKSGRYFHAFTIVKNPDILHISSKSEAKELYYESKYATENEDLIPVLKWKKLAQDKDAIHVFGSALKTEFFERWDVNSTV